MDVSRLVKLERDMAQLKSELRSLRSPSGYGSRRQPRVAKTVDDYFSVPTYPPAPDPPTTDPVTGVETPGDPHPNTFPFVFVDAIHDLAPGLTTPTSDSRQHTSPLYGSTFFSYVYNLCDVYIPKNTLIEVFEDNGFYWTTWNGTTEGGGSSSITNNSTLQAFWLGKSQSDDPLAYPDTIDYDPIEWVAFPTEDDHYAAMSLEKGASSEKFTATADGVRLLIHGSISLTCDDIASGEEIDLEFRLKHKNAGGGTISTLATRYLDITLDRGQAATSFIVPVEMDTDEYFEALLLITPLSPTNVTQFGYSVQLGVHDMYYLKATATGSSS